MRNITGIFSLEAEQAVLGGIMVDPASLDDVVEVGLSGDDFYTEKHKRIFAAMMDLSERDTPPDMVALSGAGFDSAALLPLIEQEFSGRFVKVYAKQVRDFSLRRKLVASGEKSIILARDAKDIGTALDAAEAELFGLREQKGFALHTVRSLLKPTLKEIEVLSKRKQVVTGVSTGLQDLDTMTSGLQPGDLIIIAGRPSMGKTALALNLAENAASRGQNGLIFSLEMSKEQLVKRLLASNARVDSQRMRTGIFETADWGKMTAATERIAEMKLHINDTPALSSLEIRAQARRVKKRNGLDFLIIDYLQLMNVGDGDSRAQDLSRATKALKAMAKELKIPVILLSQLNRGLESRKDKRPINSDLKESGAIEEDADLILFPYREAVYCDKCKDGNCDPFHPGKAEIIIGKQRNGPVGTIKALWVDRLSRFENIENRRG